LASTFRANTVLPDPDRAEHDLLGLALRLGRAEISGLFSRKVTKQQLEELLAVPPPTVMRVITWRIASSTTDRSSSSWPSSASSPPSSKPRKSGSPVQAAALAAGRMKQDPVEAAEPRRVVTQRRARQDIPPAAMGAGAVEVAHLLQHARRRPGE